MSEYLPVEVIVEILKRLPVESVVKCMSVCKTWNILIKNPSFISTHLQTSLSKPPSHLFLLHQRLPNDKNTFSLHFDNDEFDELKQLPFPLAVKVCMPYFRVVGSCNGLVCLSCGQSPNIFDLIFWNPSIQKYITLPPNTGITKIDDFFGFGFDSRTNDYKLLVVGLNNKNETSSEAYLFSLNENSWKRIAAFSSRYDVLYQYSSPFVNGALHWLGSQRGNDGRSNNVILGFDLSTEEFFVINLPESLFYLYPRYLSIMKYEESSIAVLMSRCWLDLDIWVMKKYGVVVSWTKVLHFTDPRVRLPYRLGFRKNGEVLWGVDGGKMVSLDLNCLQMKHFIEDKAWIASVNSYGESLVLLDKGLYAASVSYANDSYSKEESKMA